MNAQLINGAQDAGLMIMGICADGDAHQILLGATDQFWARFTASDEYHDGRPDPMDRFSKRIINALAQNIGGEASYPSDGPPYPPFISWALASGQFFSSPVGMLIHDCAGLWVSLRGAIRVSNAPALTPPAQSRCDACADKPCLTACPVSALGADQAYDVPTCKSFLKSKRGGDCMGNGCLVRRVCPVSQTFGRSADQSAFHMQAFVSA